MRNRFAGRAALFFIVAAGLACLAACGSDDTPVAVNPAANAPTLPATSTMKMDLSFFGLSGVGAVSSPDAASRLALSAAGTGKDNWINAVVRVLFVELTLYAAFEEPIGAFAAAINSVPQLQPDGSWLWTFIFVDGNIAYSIFLFGTVATDRVQWRMEVSSNDPAFLLDRFVWFDGESMLDESSGFWQFYTPVLGPMTAAAMSSAVTPGVPTVRIDWQNIGPGEHRLTVLVNEVGSPEEGDSLGFYESPTVGTLDYHDQDLMEDHNITWYPDGSGSITVPDYNNGLIACWDANRKDVACP